MRYSFTTVLLFVLLTRVSILAQAQTYSENPVVAAGTTARLSLHTPISSKLNEVGDQITALLEEKVLDRYGRVAIPAGTEFIGRIEQIQPARLPQRGASMTLVFEKMRLSSGIENISTVVTAIDDYSNERKLNAKNNEGKVEGGRSVERTGRNMARGATAGGLLGAAVAISGGGFRSIPIGLDIGIVGGALVTKGNEIRLGPETIIRIRFERPVPVAGF